MKNCFCYALFAGALLLGLPAAARPVVTFASTPATTCQPPDSLHESATTYARYLAHTLRLQGSQSEDVMHHTEAYLWALKVAGSDIAATEKARLEYYYAMLRILTSQQYGTFCWLQERERGADQVAAAVKP